MTAALRSDATSATGVRRAWPDVALAAAVALLVLGPLLLERGFVLVGDMVFVPTQPWKDAWTGGDGAVPRAVPSDAWVSLLSHVLPGALLQRVVLVGILVGAALGISRLTWQLPFVARAAAVMVFVWNPYVHERLAIGHWALLCGYAALPWVAWASVRLRRGMDRAQPGAWASLLLALAVAGWASPTGGVLTAGTALVLCWGSVSRVARVVAASVFVNLPWIVPAFTSPGQLAPDSFGVEAFAARADTPFGTLGSLVTFGGIWKESVVPGERGDLLMAAVSLALVLLGLWGLWVGRRSGVLPVVPAALLAVTCLVMAWVGAVEGVRPAVEWVVLHVPGGGLLRDGQKWVAPWGLVASAGVAQAVAVLARRSSGHGAAGQAWLAAVILAPVMALPSLALGLGGFLHADPFPGEWEEMKRVMVEQDLAGERVVVLPFSTYRRFDWTPRTVFDPAPRYFPGIMVTEDALTVPTGTVGGESASARRIRQAETAEALTAVLTDEGIAWALVHASTDREVLPGGAITVAANDQLSLLRLPDVEDGDAAEQSRGKARAFMALDLVVLLGTLGAAVVTTLRSRK